MQYQNPGMPQGYPQMPQNLPGYPQQGGFQGYQPPNPAQRYVPPQAYPPQMPMGYPQQPMYAPQPQYPQQPQYAPQQQFQQQMPMQGYAPQMGYPNPQQLPGMPMMPGMAYQAPPPPQPMYQQMPPQQYSQQPAGFAQQHLSKQQQGQPLQNTQDIMNCAQILRRAMKGLGTDEKAIIQVASTHNATERAAIAESFCSQFGMTLERELHKELSGNLRNVLEGAFQDRYVYWARKIDEAIRGAGTDEKRLIQLILLMNDQDNKIVNEVYKKIYNRDMFVAISNDISNNDWGRLLKAWMKGENTLNVDPNQAADQLYQAAKGAGTDEDVFIRILCTSSPQVFRQIAAAYQQKYGLPLRKTIIKEFSMRSEFAFLLAHDYLMDPAGACAFLINKAVKGLGTDDESLINVTILYGDYFKGDAIKRAYSQFGDVTRALKSDLSGKYETAVLGLWGLL